MRRWWAELQRAQERHLRRHDVCGREALAALEQQDARMRWHGDRLRGHVLPD